MGVISNIWDNVSGETKKRNQRWRQETLDATEKTRLVSVRTANTIWSKRNDNIRLDLDIHRNELDSVFEIIQGFSDNLKQEESSSTKPIKPSLRKAGLSYYQLKKIVEKSKENFPYNYSDTTYYAEHDEFLGAINNFIETELADFPLLRAEWADFYRDTMKILV